MAAAAGDPAPLAGLSTASCESCAKMAAHFAEYKRLGKRIVGTAWEPDSISLNSDDGNIYTVVARVHQMKRDILNTAGKRVDVLEDDRFETLFTLRYNSGWTVTAIQR